MKTKESKKPIKKALTPTAKVEAKVKAKPKAKASKVSTSKPKPVETIEKKAAKKTTTGKARIEVKAKAKPKAKASKVAAVKPKPLEKIEKKTVKKRPVTPKAKVEAKVKAKPKAKVSKASTPKPRPVDKIEKKTVKKTAVTGKAKIEAKVKVRAKEKPKAKVTKITALKSKPVVKAKKKAVITKAKVEAKVKAKPKARKVSKISAIMPRPVVKIEKKTVTSGHQISLPSKSVKSATEPLIETRPGIKEATTKTRIKKTPTTSRSKVPGITLMGRISKTSIKESPVPESSAFNIIDAGEKADVVDVVTRDSERVPLTSSRARLKIFLPEQYVTKEEAEEIFLGGLPEEYGVNSVIALVVDPNTVFVDWEIIPKDISAMEGELNLRFYDITGIEFNNWTAHSVLDVPINKRVGSGFFEIRMYGRDVVVAVGILNAVSGFMPIVRSDRVSIPELLTFDELGIVQKLFESGIPVGY